MNLETARLVLRPYEMNDGEGFHRLMSCREVWIYATQKPHDNFNESETLLKERIRSYDGMVGFHALVLKDGDNYIGEAGILSLNPVANRCTVGYNLLPDYWRAGYATEITTALAAYAFDTLSLHRIEALAQKANTASCKVLEKSGFKLEGLLRDFARMESGYEDVCYYAMLSGDR